MNAPKFKPNLKITSAWGAAMVGVIILIIVIVAAGVAADLREEEGFLGTDATLMSDLTVLAYVFMLVPLMLFGFLFARRKQFVPNHQVIMTGVVLLNWGLISFIMAVRFYDNAQIDYTGDDALKYQLLPLVHMFFGLIGQVFGTYLVIRMWFEDSLPAALKIKRIKPMMRMTLACWLIAATLGVITYVSWYNVLSEGDDQPAPAATPEMTEEPLLETTEAAPVATEEIAPEATQAVQPEATEAVEPAETEEAEPAATEEAN